MGAPDKTRIKRLLGLVSERCAVIVCPNAEYEAAVWEVFTGGFAIVPVAVDRIEAMAAANLAIYADLSAFDEPDMHKLAGFITPACAKWNLENQIAAETVEWSAVDQITVGVIELGAAATAAALADRIHHVPTFAAHRLSPLFEGDHSPVFLVNEGNRDLIERALRFYALNAAPKVGDVDPAVVATVQAESDKVAAGEDWAVIDPGNVAMPYTKAESDQPAGEDRPALAPAPEPRDDRHGNHAMLAKMDPKEPFFILRGQDVFASGLVKQWADLAESGGVRRDKIENARQCARAMRQWPVKKLPD